MKVLSVKFDNRRINKMLGNAVSYSYGFLDGVQMERLTFNRFLGGIAAEALGKYIDAKARGNPEMLHHVYEPGNVGVSSQRLFRFNVDASPTLINFNGAFLPSSKTPLNGGDVFVDRASVMESGISITIAPKNAEALVFEYEGETVFTSKTIVIDHPGGDAVAGAFGRTVSDFFDVYFTNAILKPLVSDLSTAEEFVKNFSAGTRGGRSLGVRAGRQYLKVMREID